MDEDGTRAAGGQRGGHDERIREHQVRAPGLGERDEVVGHRDAGPGERRHPGVQHFPQFLR